MRVKEGESGSQYVRNFGDLRVYKEARALAKDIFEISKAFPADERYSITSQIRRSSRSIGAQIAESWAKRLYKAHFVSKLTDSDGEQYETQHWLEIAFDCGYIDRVQRDTLVSKCADIGKMLNGMISKAKYFCQSSVKEPPSAYDF
jgi:four helix bundle protein